MRSGGKAAVIGGITAAVLGAAGYGAYALLDGPADGTAADGKPSVKTGPPDASEVRKATRGFLAAWGSGDPRQAAKYTDDREAAATALRAYRTDAHISDVRLDPGARRGSTVPFDVEAEISYGDRTTTWTYSSELDVVRERRTGRAVVNWQPSVVHPELHAGDSLKTGEAEAPPIKAVDRNGTPLTEKTHPALSGVLAGLRERYGDKAGGTAGVELWIERAGGSDDAASASPDTSAAGKKAEQPDKTLKVLSKGTPGTLRTTLDAALQTRAEKSISKHGKAAVVLSKARTGEILAVANSPAQGYNTALQGSLAPGSTMKVISSAMLIDKGLAGWGKQHPCPKYAPYGGWKFQNDKKFEIKNGTFEQSFARSCNTAFITQAEKLSDSELTKEARDVFGIGLNWQTGVPSFDGAVPVQSAAPKAASLIGQGGVRMNPLTMASVAATVRTGSFHQPYLVAPSLDKRKLAEAARPLSADTAQQLRKMMRLTATQGTAAEAMAGLGGDIGAKTGSAEVDGQKKPNGWFTAYRGDLAAAAVVPEGGHGGSSAGPVVAQLLRAGG
ncbi:penicillin-binding transpeptidase domain-containing protein [Streptomyces sp. NPDC002055]|uniref:penicillin-binding transpeptidase domain-containing protein n=1 Tax=Streptomyces sp. NPDC002055 TaxID=3154534 RepID=UPI0033227B93